MPSTSSTGRAFKSVMRSASKGEVIVPILKSLMYDPDFKKFEIKMPQIGSRPPDGWFHPSEHPTWDERKLFWYLTAPEKLIPEPLDPLSTMAIMQGHFWHEFTGTVLERAGVLHAREVHVQDTETGARGAMDGIGDWGHYEFKTMDPRKLDKIRDLDDLRRKCPEYYAQAIEYQRLSGLRSTRIVIMGMLVPYEMLELEIPWDPVEAIRIEGMYQRVRQAVADQSMPIQCCGPRTPEARACPARAICPVGVE
jgi:hypothetical protein